MKEIKPCPFCGGEAYLYHYNKDVEENCYWKIWCNEEGKFCCTQEQDYKTSQEAIEAWNRRTIVYPEKVKLFSHIQEDYPYLKEDKLALDYVRMGIDYACNRFIKLNGGSNEGL